MTAVTMYVEVNVEEIADRFRASYRPVDHVVTEGLPHDAKLVSTSLEDGWLKMVFECPERWGYHGVAVDPAPMRALVQRYDIREITYP